MYPFIILLQMAAFSIPRWRPSVFHPFCIIPLSCLFSFIMRTCSEHTTVNRAEKTRKTSSSHKRMKRNLFRPSVLDTFIHYMHSASTVGIHFSSLSAFLLVSCLFSFIMLSCCEEKQFVNERSKRGRRRTLRPTTVSFSLRLSSVSCVCGAFLRGSLCGRSVYTSACGDRAKMVRLCGSLFLTRPMCSGSR